MPAIVYPRSGATYQLHAAQLGRETLQLSATAGPDIAFSFGLPMVPSSDRAAPAAR